MREMYVLMPSAHTDCRGGGGEAGELLGTEVFGQFSLVGNHVTVLHFATHAFLAGNHFRDYNTRQKSRSTCVCFPFPMLIWVSQWSQCFKTPVAQHWGGRRHISGGKTV